MPTPQLPRDVQGYKANKFNHVAGEGVLGSVQPLPK